MDNLKNTELEQYQDILLYFIAKVMSEKESEEFSIQSVDLCSQFYKFVPEEVTIGHMFIIANDTYFESACYQRKVTDYECVSHLQKTSEKGAKALFLKYDYNVFQEKWKFKKNKLIHLDDTDYVNAVNFPYLDSAIDQLYQNANGKELSLEIADQTLEQIKTTGSLYTTQNVTKRKIENSIFDSLNGKRV